MASPQPTPIPGNKGYYQWGGGATKIPWSDIDQLEQQLYGTIGGTPAPASAPPSPTPYTPYTDFGSYDGRNVGQLTDVAGPSSLGDVASGSGPAIGLNYYDAGNGITYVYDENWNYVRTETTPPPAQPSKGGNSTLGSRVGSYYNPGAGGFLPMGGSPISGATLLPTIWSNSNTGNLSVYAPRALPANSGFYGGSISMDPGAWGVSGGIGPQSVSGAAPGGVSNQLGNVVHY